MSLPSIRIADSQFAHGTSLGSGDLKLYPSHFQWYRGANRIGDIIFITESFFHRAEEFTEPGKIAWLLEPESINSNSYAWIRKPENIEKFQCVLTHNLLLKEYINERYTGMAVWYPFGGCWIYPKDRMIHEKTKNISIIASPKRMTYGHQLRHFIIEQYGDRFDGIFNDPSKYLGPDKITALRDYRYSIVIENEISGHFFTEKLIDCFMTGTIPVYWGTGFLDSTFNSKGIIYLPPNGKNLSPLLDCLTPSFYNDSLDAVAENFNIAKEYTCPEDWITHNILNDLMMMDL